MDDILPEISIKVIPGAAASEFLISSALRAGQPRSLRRLAPANLSTLRANRTITNQGVFGASRRQIFRRFAPTGQFGASRRRADA